MNNSINAQNAAIMPTNKPFYIQSALGNGTLKGFWDLPGYPKIILPNLNLQVYRSESNLDRKYTLVKSPQKGYYEIYVGDTKQSRIDVQGDMNKNGTNVKTWETNGGANQRFLFKRLRNGNYKIYTTTGKAICTAGRSAENSTNIHIWDDQDGPWVEWQIIDVKTGLPISPLGEQTTTEAPVKGTKINISKFKIQSAMCYGRNTRGFWDIPGGVKEFRLGQEFQVWNIDNGPDREYTVKKKKNSSYYQIKVATYNNAYLDLANGNTTNGTKLLIWKPNNTGAQNYYFEHLGNGRFKIHHESNKVIALAGANDANGTKIQIWDDHNAIQCEWYLIKPDGKAYIPE